MMSVFDLSPDEINRIRAAVMEAVLVFFYCTIPGAAGGVVGYFYGIKRNLIRNNKFVAKFCLEVVCASLTCTFVPIVFPVEFGKLLVGASFAVGFTWSGIIQIVRDKITNIARALLGYNVGGGGVP